MNRVETARHPRIERGRRLEQLIVELHQVETLQEPACTRERRGPMSAHRAEDFHPRETARGPLRLIAKETTKRSRLRFRDDELHQRGGIEIDQALPLP